MPSILKRFAIVFNLGAFASILMHALILAPMVFGFPQLTLKPEEPEAVEVELAPPQEKPKPEPTQKAPPPPPPPKPGPRPEAPVAQAKPKTPQVMRPVVKFGEKDAGSTKTLNGDSRRDARVADPTPAAKRPEKQARPPAAPPPALPPKADGVATATAQGLPGVRMPAEPVPPERNRQARLQSRNEGDVATTAAGDLPRAIRAGQLCATELRRKLNNSNPPYFPDLLPAYRLDQGNVLRVRRGAFRANAGWYNLEFRCEVDEAATEVVTLDFTIGAPVPRGDWTRRGFPSD